MRTNMLDETQTTTQAMYTKQSATGLGAVNAANTAAPTPPMAPPPGTSMGTSSAMPPKKSGNKNLMAIIGGLVLLAFLVVGGVLVYRFTQTEETTAPTQTLAGSCSLTFTVTGETPPPTPGPISCVKESYQDEFSNVAGDYDFLKKQTTFEPGDVVVYKIDVDPSFESTSSAVVLTDVLDTTNLTFLDSTCAAGAYNTTTNTLTCEITEATTSATIAFRATIKSTVADATTISNSATVVQGNRDAECKVDVTVTDEPTYACNSTCTTDAQCQGVNANYVCHNTGSGSFCRLNSNTSSASCQPGTGGTTYSCNSTCETDEQCRTANADYICYDSTDGNKYCRLDTNRTSNSCTPPAQTYACNSTCTTNAQCQTANSNYICHDTGNGSYCRHQSHTSQSNCQAPNQPTPTPTIGCNQTCETNSDCSNPDHICYTTDTGKKCRLADYVNSASCTKPGTTVTTTPTPVATTTTPTPTPVNPEEVEELPVAGTEDLIKMIGAGAGALILGGLFILLLL